jgi:hypothetical protein
MPDPMGVAGAAHTVSPITGGMFALCFSAVLMVCAVLWYRYAARYYRWLESKQPDSLRRFRSSSGRGMPEFTRNSGAVFLLIAAILILITGLRDLIG